MTTTKTAPKAAETISARIGDAKDIATDVGGALAAGSKAYVGGVLELGRTLVGFGREIASDAAQHVKATMQAKNLREVAELQAAFAQHRVEMTATYSKEIVDLARARSEDVIAPLTALLKQDKKAA